jgi:hypothetical protein
MTDGVGYIVLDEIGMASLVAFLIQCNPIRILPPPSPASVQGVLTVIGGGDTATCCAKYGTEDKVHTPVIGICTSGEGTYIGYWNS